MRRTKINLLFILTLAIAVGCALWGTKASADNGSPISYHNGPVMNGTSNLYVIWYGNWSASTGPNSLDTQTIVTNFLTEIGGSINFQINATYPAVNGAPSGGLIFGWTDTNLYRYGTELDAASIQSVVAESISKSHLPYDANGIYIVIPSSDVYTDTTGFCTPNARPLHGSFFQGGGPPVKYAFIGNPARCPSVAAPQFFAPDGSQLPTPNGNLAADAMVSAILHALDATVTDPFRTAWFDGSGLENADKCQGSFSHTHTLANGARVNFAASVAHNYLIQDNWVNNFGGYCGQQNDAPPRADNQTVQVIQDNARQITLTATDDNGDPMSFIIVTPPQHGTLTGSGADRTYTPASNFHGADSFAFKANDGTLDSTVATVSINVNANSALDGFDPNANGLVRTAVVQPDGKILIGGDFTTLAPNGRLPVTRNYIARLNIDGTVDPTFDPSANSSVQAIALQPDGKIILGGDFSALAPNGGASVNRLYVARLNADGTLDATLDPRANGSVHAIAVQADGGIVIGGEFQQFNPGGGATVLRNRIARMNPDWTLDTLFNPNANSTVDTLAVQPDGRILMGGRFTTLALRPGVANTITRNYVARLNVDGAVDQSFDPNPDSIVGSVAVQPDGKVLLGGAFTSLAPNDGSPIARNHLARMNVNGTLDTAFNPNVNGFVRTIVLQPDGKTLIGGGFTSVTPSVGTSVSMSVSVSVSVLHKYIARLNPDGSLDPGLNPSPNDQVLAIAVQADGKIIVGGAFFSANSFSGQTRNRIARLETDGRLDQTLNLNAGGGVVYTTAVQPDGKILIGGGFTDILGVGRNRIARLNTDGTLDPTFNPNANGTVEAVAVQPDGKIVVGGLFTSFTPAGGVSVTRNHIVRLNADGSVDMTFDPNANDYVYALALQGDGKILLGGPFTALAPNGGGSINRKRIARLNADGSVDQAFNPSANDIVQTITLGADGKILAGGAFTTLAPNNGAPVIRNYIARLNTDGTVDTPFDPNANDKVSVITVQSDGKIIVGGFFNTLAPNGGISITRHHIARLSADGDVDPTFNPNADGIVVSIALQADGKILASGGFTSFAPNDAAPVARHWIARLNSDGTVDPAIDPEPSDAVFAIALQPDGKILVGGSFDSISGQARSLFARLANDTAAIQNLAVTPATITWARSGAAPLVSRVIFERSSDGSNYTFLGNGARIGTSSDFILEGQTLPTQQNLYVRARGFYAGGGPTGMQSSITESVRNVFLPPALHLAFGQQPTNTAETGVITPAVTVQILDASNNLVNSSAAVTIGVGTNPSSGTLTGTTAVSASGGTATFNNLSIDKIGNGYTLAASGTNLPGTVSNPFNITVGAPASIAAIAGSGQSATINLSFATAFQARVADSFGNPVSGAIVTFTAPASGASGTFSNNTATATAMTGATGVAIASNFTANGVAGSYSISASMNGGAMATTFTLANIKANQSINVTTHAPATAAYNSQFNVSAASSAGLPIAYSGSGPCTNNGAAFTMTMGTGTCTVKYEQPGDANHNAAVSLTETVTAQKAAQSISFEAVPDKTFGDSDFLVNATSNSGLSVNLAASGNCSNTGSTIHLSGAGACSVTASQSGNSAYDAAADVVRAFTIRKAAQTIVFDTLGDKTFGDLDFTVNGSVSSGLSLSYAASGQCAGTASNVHLNGAGLCTITVSQAGDSNYQPATDVARSFQIFKASTRTEITSSSNAPAPGAIFAATVSSDAGVPNGTLTFTADGTAIASCSDLVLTAGRATCATSAMPAGTYTFTAQYSGDANFNPSNGSITGEQAGSTFEFSQATYVAGEHSGSITITVRRSGDVSSASSVDYLTDDGSVASVAVPCSLATGFALERCDYTRAAGRLEFAANDTEKTFVVLLNDDSYIEGTETASLKLVRPSEGAALGSQATATLQIIDDATESLNNPVDDDANFVRQHYHDFLNREPDAEGLKFWTNNITSCDTDVCVGPKRVDTSAAFFLSIEFQETGYLVQRFYKAAYGDATGASTLAGPHQLPVPIVRLDEFLHDTQEIGNGVIVTQAGWQQQLENRKQAFAREFVSRDRFTNSYPAALTAEQFVSQLNANAGGVLTNADMLQLEDVFGGSSAASSDVVKRAQVLRLLAENQTLQQKEFNRAFVLMQYFGYLRRNPDDAQDNDYTGYDFWLGKLDQFGGNYINAEMVKAFISSTEYRQRFGQ